MFILLGERKSLLARRGWVLAGVLVGLSVVVPSAWAVPPSLGGLTPLGCFENTGGGVCGVGNQTAGLLGAFSVAVSPDGTSVYAASPSSNAVVRFNRGTDGALTPAGCIENTGGSVCGAGNQTAGLLGAFSVAVSPDGASVYVASIGSSAVVRFNRGAGGALTPAGCIENTGGSVCGAGNQTAGLGSSVSVAVSPDGASVYAASISSSAVVRFNRGAGGALTPAGCFENTGGSVCGAGNQIAGLPSPESVAVSPDGASVYVASSGNTVARFNRGAGGALTPAGCFENTGGSVCGAGNQTAGLLGPQSVAVSPDGASVYVASISSNAVVRFNRGAGGALTPAGCIENTAGSVCGAGNQTAGLGTAASVAVSPDGASVYVAANDNAVVRFNRGAGGALTPAGCIENTGGSVCGAGNQTAGLNFPQSVAVSPDGASVYVASHNSNAVVRFARELAPSCTAVARNVAAATPTTIPLSCSDLNFDPLTLAIIGTPPAHGTLGAIDQAAGTVLYTPVAGYAGPDSFSYKANDGALDSNTATVNLSVAGAPPQSGCPPNCPPPVRPAVVGLSQSATKWRAGDRLAQISKKKKPPVGTTFGFSLNEAAAVRLDFTRPAAGRKVSKKCLPVSKKNRKKPKCTRTVIVGTLAFKAHAGANRVRFAGRLSATKKLKPGHYTLTITATSAGLRSTPRSLSFTIVK